MPEQATFADKAWLRSFEDVRGGQSIGNTLLAIGSIATGVGVGVVIHETAFSAHDQYDTITGEINQLQDKVHSLQTTEHIAGNALLPSVQTTLDAKTASLTKSIAVKEKSLPENYNPNVDTAASFMGGVAAIVVAMACGGQLVRNRLDKARARVKNNSQAPA